MELTAEQKQTVEKWAKDGCTLSEIQKKLDQELGLKMTYMDARFLIINFGIELQDKISKPAPETISKEASVNEDAQATEAPSQDGTTNKPSDVAVEVDKIKRPDSIVSGTVKFSDGVSAIWYVDQTGRLALDPGKPDYRPTEEDLASFQNGIKNALKKLGF